MFVRSVQTRLEKISNGGCTMLTQADYTLIFDEAERISVERGHAPDSSDLDLIVEDALTLAKQQLLAQLCRENVINALKLLISGVR